MGGRDFGPLCRTRPRDHGIETAPEAPCAAVLQNSDSVLAEVQAETVRCGGCGLQDGLVALCCDDFDSRIFRVFDLWLRSDDRAAPARPPLHVFGLSYFFYDVYAMFVVHRERNDVKGGET